MTAPDEQIRRVAEAAQAASRRGAHGEAVACYRELVALAPLAACFNNFGLALARDAAMEAKASERLDSDMSPATSS